MAQVVSTVQATLNNSTFVPRWTPGKKAAPTCLYDVILSGMTTNPAEGLKGIDAAYNAIRDYVLRAYSSDLKPIDLQRYADLDARGGPALKTMFILMILAHDPALRRQIETSAAQDEATQRKIQAFYRTLAISLRSIYVAPFTENSIKRIILTALQFCYFNWASFDADGITNYCDAYAARSDLPIP